MKKSKLILCLASLGISAAFMACGDSTSASDDFLNRSEQDNPESSSSEETSSSSVDASGSSSSVESSATSSSSEKGESSSSGVESSSSDKNAFIKPIDTVVEKCSVSGGCDKMDRDDVSTWHFVRKDNFGDNMEYIYTVDGETLVLTTIDKDGVKKVDETSYSFYDMTKEASQQMAFSAIKSTCEDGGGNDIGDTLCTKDSTTALPKCDASLEGKIGAEYSRYYVCESGEWRDAEQVEYDTYGNVCADSTINKVIKGKVANLAVYYCTEEGWEKVDPELYWDVPKEARFNPDIDYDTIIDSRDQQVYRIVTIGDQTWMAENLNYADSVNTPSLKGSSWCYNNNDEACALFGRLYTWAAAIDSVALANDPENPQTCGMDTSCTLPDNIQGICPDGWRLPTKLELEDLAGGIAPMHAGEYLKTRTGWGSGKGGSDTYGFSALPTGLRNSSGKFTMMEERAIFMSETVYGKEVQVLILYDYTEHGSLGVSSKDSGLSIRCIKK